MAKTRKTPFVLSVLLHLSFFIYLAFYAPDDGGGTGHGKFAGGGARDPQKQVQIVPKEVEIEVLEVPPQTEKGKSPTVPPEPPQKKEKNAVHQCEGEKWFGGIGIEENEMIETITKVAAGYPAEKAGLRAGDIIVNVDGLPAHMGQIRGTPGTTVILTISRLGARYDIMIVRDRICTDK